MDIMEDLWLKRYREIRSTYSDTLGEDDEWPDELREEINIYLNSDLLIELLEITEEGITISS